MTEAQDKFLESFDKKYNRMRNTLLTIIGIVLTVFLSSIYLMGKSQGKIEANITEISNLLKLVSKDYAPAWYMKGITDLYALNTEKMAAVLAGDKQEEIIKINNDLKRTVEIMQNQFIQMRGGMNTTERSIENKNNGGSQ
jgi:hypothetical protein